MNTSPIRFSVLCSFILCVAFCLGNPHAVSVLSANCHAQEPASQQVHSDVTRAVTVIRSGKEGVSQGFQILRETELDGACPDELLALVHTKGEAAGETIWRLGMLIATHKLSISGKQLAAEYEQAGKTGRRARRALCALAAHQTGRIPMGGPFVTSCLPKPKALDEETLALLARALREDDPAVRVAAADSIRLGAIRNDRFRDPLLKAIEDENCVVSDAASLAAADFSCDQAGPLILRQLEAELRASWEDRRDDMAACGFPLAPIDEMRLWDGYFSPQYGGDRLIVALKTLRYRPALALLRRMAAPHERTEEEVEYLTGGENVSGDAEDLAAAILEIENRPDRPDRPAALLQLAEDATLAGNVRAAALRMFDDRDSVRPAFEAGTGKPLVTEFDKRSHEPEILKRVLKLIDDKSPITDHRRGPSRLGRLGRLAIQVAAHKFDTRSIFYQGRLHSMGEPIFLLPVDVPRRFPDPAKAYPKDLLPLRRQFLEKMVSLFSEKDAALALEALAVVCPEWGTSRKYIDIATDPKRPPLLRVAAANLLTWQPTFLEMEGGGIDFGRNAPPKTASKLMPLLGTRKELQGAVTGVFLDLLGYPDSELSKKQKAARDMLLPKLRAMRGAPHADAALDILLRVYGFSRPSTAWDPAVGDPADKPKWPDVTGVGTREGAPAKVTVERKFSFRHGIRFCDMVQDGKCILVGDGSTLLPSGSSVMLIDPQDLSDKAKTSIAAELPWSSNSVAVGPDEQHALVFNRYLELKTLKTVSVLDVKQAVAKGNVRPMPLAISPDGKSALVHVASYLSSEFDALALFDLKSGGLKQVIDVGEARPFSNACFLNEKEIAVHGNRGCVLAVDLENGTQRDLCDDGPRSFPSSGMNWCMTLLTEGRYLVVSGHDGFVVIETSQGKELFRKKVERGNAVPVQGGRCLLYQAPSQDFGRPLHFFCVRVSDGRVVSKFSRQDSYETLMPGEDDGVVYAVKYGTLSRLLFRWPDQR